MIYNIFTFPKHNEVSKTVLLDISRTDLNREFGSILFTFFLHSTKSHQQLPQALRIKPTKDKRSISDHENYK